MAPAGWQRPLFERRSRAERSERLEPARRGERGAHPAEALRPAHPGGPSWSRRRRRGRLRAPRPRPPSRPAAATAAAPLPAAPRLEWKHGGAGSDLRRLSARPRAHCATPARLRPLAWPQCPAPGVRAPAPAGTAAATSAAALAARRPRRLCLQLPSAAHVSVLGRPRDPGRALRPSASRGPSRRPPLWRGRWIPLPAEPGGGGPSALRASGPGPGFSWLHRETSPRCHCSFPLSPPNGARQDFPSAE